MFQTHLLKVFKEPELYRDMSVWNANLIEYEGKEYLISHRAILTVTTTATCNAACPFCYNDITFTPDNKYLNVTSKVIRALTLAKVAGVKKVALSGGEPTANPPKLLALLRIIAPDFPKIWMHTNGLNLLRKLPQGGDLLEHLLDEGLTGISISIAHFDQSANGQIMVLDGGYRGLTDEDLRELSERCRERNVSLRLSCVLTSDGIRTVDDIAQYMSWGESLGIRRFVFRAAARIPSVFSLRTKEAAYNRSQALDIKPMVEAIGSWPEMHETFQEHKTDSHLHVFSRGTTVVDFDASSEEIDPPDRKIRRLNLMPNEVLYSSWLDPRSVIFEEDLPIALDHKEFTNV